MNSILQDLRFAFRQLRRSCSSAFTAVVTLGPGIGSTTTIFSLVDTVLLRPLPFMSNSASRLNSNDIIRQQ